MQPITLEMTCGAKNPTPYVATRAIMRLLATVGLPKVYATDVAIDVNWLYDHPTVTRFVFVWREHGTNIIADTDRLLAEWQVFGRQCKFYTYDEDWLPGRWQQEPELLECTYEEAAQFLIPRRDQARYLSKRELKQIGDCLDKDLTEYLRSDEHQPSAGLCFEVLLTEDEARDVDRICEQLEIV